MEWVVSRLVASAGEGFALQRQQHEMDPRTATRSGSAMNPLGVSATPRMTFSDQHRVGEQQESALDDDIPSNSRSAKARRRNCIAAMDVTTATARRDVAATSRTSRKYVIETVADVFIRWRRSDLDLHAKLHHTLRRQSEECCRSYRVPSHQDE
jgi:hypothetical protein